MVTSEDKNNKNNENSQQKDIEFDEKIKKEKHDKENKKKEKKLSKNDKIKELEQQVEELKNDNLRCRADFENFRKRKEKELNETREKAVVNFVLDILPSIDNFESSLKMTDNKEMFIKGVEMIHKNLIDTLKENHFIEFEPQIDEEFDPYHHDPVLIEDKSKKPGSISEILQKGYKYKDKVVRPARVKIVKHEEDSNQENNE
jgi:molecular chaperone GrpE